ncbi:alpha/beta hydrolase [Paeniglutamicibacter cryotolerans]|uniref:Alpha-beta hydrolase superfamily lysophospholipase n=1 Tax=Paeniglutamicibacter cryotolerans TaxID=670079 RepID=A0A839QL92_9MICC|nr:alpha/beta hydrolase [Paeniglutamicibacter cryotolerans]MBB2997188.1 alpha-beta hydrolase superfamily lysophospholipase [Paeniglutamicibacter cryotolerans]
MTFEFRQRLAKTTPKPDSPLDSGSSPPEEYRDPSGDWPSFLPDSEEGQWLPDILGPDYSYTTLPLPPDEDGDVRATLVRYRPASTGAAGPTPARAGFWRRLAGRPGPGAEPPRARGFVLYLHGWSDYYYNTALAEYWNARGYHFYAVDLRRYGRSLRAGEAPGYVSDLTDYDADLKAALDALAADAGEFDERICVAHSTGGLIATLWAERHPGIFTALVLNSPWLELQGSHLVRYAATGVLDPVARLRPKAKLRLPEADQYWQTLSRLGHGTWDLHPVWRPQISFPVTAGWLRAVMAGHAKVAHGLNLRIPVLVLTSARTHLSPVFDQQMLFNDAVIEVEVVRERSLGIGTEVTNAKLIGAMHDVFTSGPEPRAAAFAAIDRWSTGYLNGK